MAGLGLALGLFLVFGVSGLVSDDGLAIVGLFGQYLALFVAGYVAGRLAAPAAVLNGGLSALTVFAVSVALSVSGGTSPGLGSLLFLGVVAVVLGTAGGVLAGQPSR
jgi:hypothetical protein